MRCAKCGDEKTRVRSGRLRCRPCEAAYQRDYYRKNISACRAKSKEAMARRRSCEKTREVMNSARRGVKKYADTQRQYNRRLRKKHFFKYRARMFGRGVTAVDLMRIWVKQSGRCALSGEKMGRDAHIDHIIPRSKGGNESPENLRWLDPWVNVARQNLDDEEFVRRCAQVAEFVGRLVMEHELLGGDHAAHANREGT